MTERSDLLAMPPASFVSRDLYRIAYSVIGPQDGVPLVLCHGLAAAGVQFRADAEFFAAAGFRVLVPDLRGHGRSISPDARSDDDFTLSVLASDLLAVLDAEAVSDTYWVGNSLGGILALKIIETQPERLRSLVTFGTAHSLDVPRSLVALSDSAQRIAGRRVSALVTAWMTTPNPAARKLVAAVLRQIDWDAVMRVARAVAQYDLRAAARGFGKPMLLLRGSNDRAVNATLGPTFESMAGCGSFSRIDIEGAGHCANLDRPDVVRQAVLDFLRAADAQPV